MWWEIKWDKEFSVAISSVAGGILQNFVYYAELYVNYIYNRKYWLGSSQMTSGFQGSLPNLSIAAVNSLQAQLIGTCYWRRCIVEAIEQAFWKLSLWGTY